MFLSSFKHYKAHQHNLMTSLLTSLTTLSCISYCQCSASGEILGSDAVNRCLGVHYPSVCEQVSILGGRIFEQLVECTEIASLR